MHLKGACEPASLWQSMLKKLTHPDAAGMLFFGSMLHFSVATAACASALLGPVQQPA
jgi:hypothetical protein